MKFKWEIKPITEIVKFNPSYTIKKGMSVPYVEMAAVPEYNREIAYFDERIFSSGSKFKNGDTLFSRITPCLQNGKTAKVSGLENDKIGNGSTEFIVMSAIDKSNDEDFVYYISLDKSFRKYAEGRMEGTTGRQRVSWQALSEYELPIPPKEDRKKIAHILSTLDDKIELNRKMNQTLEEMAQALFKSWFVDFDPVHAKAKCSSDEELEAAAKELGISKEILELFPSEFEESELGMIPKGWEVSKIEDILKRYKAPKRYKKDAVESYGKTVVLEQGADIILGYHNHDSDFEASVEEPMFIFGDHTCVMKLSTKPFSISENVIPLSGLIRNGYWTYYTTYGQQTFQEYRRHWSELIVRKIVLADKNICNLFARQIEPMILKIEQNIEENNELIMTRDTLLPKLLSGELDVSETQL